MTRGHSDLGENAEMKKWIVTSLLAIGLAPAALAAEKFFVIVDTVGNCFVVQSTPNTALSLVPEVPGFARTPLTGRIVRSRKERKEPIA